MALTSLAWFSGAGFILSILLILLARPLAVRCDLVDRPDGRRKIHREPIPVTGGLAVFAGVCLSLVALGAVSQSLRDVLAPFSPLLWGLFLAALVLCIVGVADDFGYLRGRHKLIGQIVALS